MHTSNYVLLLRHCVRSTKTEIEICNGNSDKDSPETKVHISDYITAPLPDYGTPPMWCTEQGINIMAETGRYLMNHVMNEFDPEITHVNLNIISDTSQRDVDTSLALLRGIKEELMNTSSITSFRGVDDIKLAPSLFGSDDPTGPMMCPPDEDIKDNIHERIDALPPQDFYVQDVLGLLTNLGLLANNVPNNIENILDDWKNQHCPRSAGLYLNLLKKISEMAFYSRASGIDPPFLPTLSEEELYKMLYVADYVRTLERMDSDVAVKKGLIIAKTLLNSVLRPEKTATPSMAIRSNDRSSATITIVVGHDSNIDHVATVLGLRWTMPPPYFSGSRNQVGKIVSSPPGSGIIFASSNQDVSMSYLVPANLMDSNNSTLNFDLVPIYTVDGKSHGKISTSDLRKRLVATMNKYPSLHSCYENAPNGLGESSDYQESSLSISLVRIASILLTLALLINVVLLAVLRRRQRRREYERVIGANIRDVEVT